MDDTTNQFDDDVDARLKEHTQTDKENKACIKESRDEVTLAKVSFQPQSSYEAAATLTEFELKKILIYRMEKKQRFFISYDVYSLKRGQKYKDKDEEPSAGSDRGSKRKER
ncbi:hypothetical protein Tco_0837586 [Tanacetum coccineum]